MKRFEVRPHPDKPWLHVVTDTAGEEPAIPHRSYKLAKRCAARLNSLYEQEAPAVVPPVLRLVAAVTDIEAELREQASGSQDGWLLSIADRLREAVDATEVAQ